MGLVHINRTGWNWNTTPAWATHERFTDVAPDKKLLTDCCCCRMRADETVCTIWQPPCDPNHGIEVYGPHESGRWDRHRECEDWWMSYYDPTVKVFCGGSFGCQANPRRKRGTAMREFWRWAA